MNNTHHQLIIGALANMVEEDGLTPHEAFKVLEDIKQQTFHALTEIYRKRKVST